MLVFFSLCLYHLFLDFYFLFKNRRAVRIDTYFSRALVIVRTGVEGNFIFPFFIQINPVVRLILHARAGGVCRKAHIVRIFGKERAVGFNFKRSGTKLVGSVASVASGARGGLGAVCDSHM